MAPAAAQAPHPSPPPPPTPEAQQEQQRPSKDQQQKALAVNAIRLKAIGDRIKIHLRGMGVLPTAEFAHLVYAFARGIDFAVSAGDIPPVAGDIPGILRKVYELRKEPFIRSALMVLVISCKNACSNKWFQPPDSTDILRMANELSGYFCTSPDPAVSDRNVLEIISKIMPRYYPRLKFERLITSIEAKVGYAMLLADFFVARDLARDEKIRLIVVQKENLDASSCITSPPHVSFLINGKGVDKRTNVSMEPGPQFPTDITKMLKYGANIIQVVGYFNANYIIALALVSNLASVNAPKLDDYAQPVTVDPTDSDVLEGPSRVSLNCPISLSRIKTPIKGRMCKHYQCFDYDNYIEMNSRKPNWRCPYCNTPSSFIDLRIDQKMAKILQETGDDIIDVLIFTDGSWKAAAPHDIEADRCRADATQQTGDTVETDSSSHIIDLINGNDDGHMTMNWTSASEDTKPQLDSQDLSVEDYLLPDFPMAPAQAEDLHLRNGNNRGSNMALTSHQNLALSSTNGLDSSFGTLESILPRNVLCPVITDAVSPSLETTSSMSGMQHISQGTHRETVQLQPQIGPTHGSEVRRLPIPRNPRREPIGVQALAVPPQNPVSSRLMPNILNCPPPTPLSTPASSTYQAHQVTNSDSVIAPTNNVEGPLPRTPSAAAPHQQSTMRDTRSTQIHLPSRVVGLPAPHLRGARMLGMPGLAGGVNTHRAAPTSVQQTPSPDQLQMQTRMNQTALAAAGQTTAAAQFRPTQADIQSPLFPALQQSQVPRSQAVPRVAAQSLQRAPPHLQSSSTPAISPSTPQTGASDDVVELPVDENWCPSGRMRGSLTGNAYSSAIRRYMGQPDQQGTRPPGTSGARRPQ